MVAISFALESTGEAAYMGGVTVLKNKQLLTTAAVSIAHRLDCDSS